MEPPMPTRSYEPFKLFIDSFNAELADLGSAARVGVPRVDMQADLIELLDDEGNLIDFIPSATEPQMAAIAYRLYARAFNLGVSTGENAAWAKLRHLIGAAAPEGAGRV
jgi:hypothetical protein